MAKLSKQQEKPSEDQWRDLYAAANTFKKTVCWEWMEDCDIFGVQDPVSRQNFYCSIMGNGGTEFGLVAYRGYQGFQVLHRLLTIETDVPDTELADEFMYIQNALSCTFDDREQLGTPDLAVIRSLGLKYRGRNAWPCFRDYTPGLVPWFLTGPQCVTLTHVLNQAVQVAMECKKAKKSDILFGPNDEISLRVSSKTADGLVWKSRFMHEKEEQMEVAEITLSDQLLVQKLKKLPLQKRTSWELDRFYLPTPVHEPERPYFPQMLAIVDHGDGMVLSGKIIEGKMISEELPADELMEVLLAAGRKPHRILVKQERLYILLGKFCEQIGIEIRPAEKLPKIAEMRQSFLEFSRR